MPNNPSRKRISRNIIASVSQVFVSGLVFFILYRYLYDQLGVDQIGIWSLVLATTSVSRIGDLGLSAGVVKFVAQAIGRGERQYAVEIVQTVALTLGAVMAILLLILYPLFSLSLDYFLPLNAISIATSILPYALMSLWCMVLVSVFSGGLDGCMKMYLRSIIIMLSHLAYLWLAIHLVPEYGLEGVAIAQLLQAFILMIVSWIVLKSQLEECPIIPFQWRYEILRDMFGYGVNFQIITILNMIFDPAIKVIMSKFGGLESLGYYEMANKLILQGRALIVEGSRVMVPEIASLKESIAGIEKNYFITSYHMIFYISILFYGVLGVLATTISLLWIGEYKLEFIHFVLILNIGWFVNTLIAPAYFSNLGTGDLRHNVFSHLFMVFCGILFCVIFGVSFGGVGVVFGVSSGLIIGSVFLLFVFVKKIKLTEIEILIPSNLFWLAMISISMVFISNYFPNENSHLVIIMGLAITCSSILLLFGWFDRFRKMFVIGKSR